jgi:hypothetical protein
MKKTNLVAASLVAGLITGSHAFAQSSPAPASTPSKDTTSTTTIKKTTTTATTTASKDDNGCGGPNGCGGGSDGKAKMKKKAADSPAQ